MKLVASSEHLRPGVDPARPPPPPSPPPRRRANDPRLPSAQQPQWTLRQRLSRRGRRAHRIELEPRRAAQQHRRQRREGQREQRARQHPTELRARDARARKDIVRQRRGRQSGPEPRGRWRRGGGLWQSPVVERGPSPFDSVPEVQSGHSSPLRNSLDLSSSPASALPDPAAGLGIAGSGSNTAAAPAPAPAHVQFVSSKGEGPKETVNESRSHTGLPTVGAQPPAGLGRTLSQKGLWGSAPGGAVSRERGPKRRWTVQQE
ncbi:hypothetical protein H2203_007958 [Taxawa tesnikishii (nom. ined.)]|nr:hypothetical protein H2203_007958 [Dothideales sp. JES 119]